MTSVQGYVIYSQRQKLRPELAGLPSAEIRERKLAGKVRISHACCQPTGDTGHIWYEGS